MALPALNLLADHGFALTLAGRPWAKDLFAAYPWTVVSLPGSRIQALRDIKVKTGLLLTNSFSSALEFRLAGISATGYARDGRSWLLRKAIPVNRRDHMVEYYYRLATALCDAWPEIPSDLQLRIGEPAQLRANDLLAAQGVDAKYVVLCPVAIGFHRGKVKAWDGFARLGSELLAAGGHAVALGAHVQPRRRRQRPADQARQSLHEVVEPLRGAGQRTAPQGRKRALLQLAVVLRRHPRRKAQRAPLLRFRRNRQPAGLVVAGHPLEQGVVDEGGEAVE